MIRAAVIIVVAFAFFTFAVGRAIDQQFAPKVRSYTDQIAQLDR